MIKDDFNELISRISKNLLQNEFIEKSDSPFNRFFYRNSPKYSDVNNIYFVIECFDEGSSASDQLSRIKNAQDYVKQVFKLKGFLKNISESYVLYFICLEENASKDSIDLLFKNSDSNFYKRIFPVWIERTTNRWFFGTQDYVRVPYEIYKFHIQELLDLIGSMIFPDFLTIPNVQQAINDIRLVNEDERKTIIKNKYTNIQAVLFSIRNLYLIRGENNGPNSDIRHALAISYIEEALITELAPISDKSAFEVGSSTQHRKNLYNQIKNQRAKWLTSKEVKALAICPKCKEIVEPIPLKQGFFDDYQKVGCPNSDKHKGLQDLVFIFPDEIEEFRNILNKKISLM
ncbi:hypothetical protein KJ742_02040 [Patescibacteria group bacterium]|nr:hypothetical protein [Patescibacteria group bacterium]